MDIALYYVEKGDGEPLILLHGNGESHEYFKYQIDFFSKEYRVIAVDTMGTWKITKRTSTVYHPPVCGGSSGVYG